ncbi:histidine phosphatase family protein [Luteolibacter yonseiensis]|uniref:Histidine phosphatase family protein n=1 Tax=Luteolibacter yonseiensis TaxID=1144680 RepID=A0A934VDB7_9BACT|nr:histidine phosphatase family protein [Luteolibacter yonseiensis]MBK1817851.1 histidine phosphatase family protein [Luteolibacter yonseiensis]
MDLILLRHGKAEDMNIGGDFTRELVEKGRDQSRRAARLLKAAKALPEIVLTSPLTRARQTADEFCQTAEIPGAVIQGWLACGMSPETALAELAAFRDFKRVAIVGHEPDFSQLIAWVLGANGGGIVVKKGSLTCLSLNPPSRYGSLVYMIPPKLAADS